MAVILAHRPCSFTSIHQTSVSAPMQRHPYWISFAITC